MCCTNFWRVIQGSEKSGSICTADFSNGTAERWKCSAGLWLTVRNSSSWCRGRFSENVVSTRKHLVCVRLQSSSSPGCCTAGQILAAHLSLLLWAKWPGLFRELHLGIAFPRFQPLCWSLCLWNRGKRIGLSVAVQWILLHTELSNRNVKIEEDVSSESEVKREEKIEILLSAPIWHAGDILKYLVGCVIVVVLFWKLGKIII